MKNILYISLDHSNKSDGGSIFDQKLCKGIDENYSGHLEVLTIPRVKKPSLPLWRTHVSSSLLQEIESKAKDSIVICGHESLFHISNSIKVDLFVITNLFSHFRFPGKVLAEKYFTFMAFRHYARAFNKKSKYLFISRREARIAFSEFGLNKTDCIVLQPPPMDFELGSTDLSTIHLSGSEGWFPKRMSKLSPEFFSLVEQNGFTYTDFSNAECRCLGIIQDRFLSGCKLKLIQMVYCQDIIFSFVDVKEEIDEIFPNYPFYFEVKDEDDLLQKIISIKKHYSVAQIESIFRGFESNYNLIKWDTFGKSVTKFIND